MRNDILDSNGNIVLQKAIGQGYNRGWFTNCPCRYRFFVGARSTKKSKDMLGYEPIYKILSDERRNVLIVRQNDSDNRQSTFEAICGCIGDLGLEGYFKVNKNPLEITYRATGQKIIFRGLNNPTALNGITFAKGFLTDVYIDEAFEVTSYQDFRKLDGTLRGTPLPGITRQITCCMNAWSQECWIYHEFFKGNLEDDFEALENAPNGYLDYRNPEYIGPFGRGLYLHKSTFRINEFRDKEIYDVAAAETKRRSLPIYQVEFLGMWGNTTASTYPEFNSSCYIKASEIFSGESTSRCAGGFVDFAIGIDTGLSNGEGKKHVIHKNDDVELKVKAATTMTLSAVTRGYQKIIVLDEYFHSNDPAYNRLNTDNQDNLTSVQEAKILIQYLVRWSNKYQPLGIMKGLIRIYVDCADIAFRQMLQFEAEQMGIYNLQIMGSTKRPIQGRVDFTRYLMAYGDFLICEDTCPNLIREFKASKHGDKGEARQDGNDHTINSLEYEIEPMKANLVRYKTFKEH